MKERSDIDSSLLLDETCYVLVGIILIMMQKVN